MDAESVITGDQIRRARDVLGLTQEDLAQRLGMKRVLTISRWENGHKSPNNSPYRDALIGVLGDALTTT